MLNLFQMTKQQPYLATFILAPIYPKQNDLQSTFYLLCQVWILTLMGSCFNDCKTIPNKNIHVCIYCPLKPLKQNNLRKSIVDFITEGYL